ncbi:ABC transporter substrate-binding protein [Polymorphospora sp. NPDC050346]|uniref:ABC transporter substrate-binding protein n=1 Tax=Polymorphospora sp. NPDC050346 TaxID=3155780 RepID=UPI00340B1BD2
MSSALSRPLRAALGGLTALGLLAAAGCGNPDAPDGAGAATGIVLADAYEDSTLNPVAGYSETGYSKIYDGLVRPAPYQAGVLPAIEPALAAQLPEPSADAREWTVNLRTGVTFHDGSTFDADDVVATYRAVLDPVSGSPLAGSFEMLQAVDKVDATTVRFTLKYPYAPFDRRLMLGIVPAESVATPGPADASPLNEKPIGTGAYKLESWRKGSEMVLTANPDHWGGEPAVKKLTVVIAADDNTRTQRTGAGEFDGAWLPPKLAATFADRDGFSVVAHPSADFRAVSLPTAHPVTGDPAIRLALNHAVDRQAMVDNILAGYGKPAYTPIPDSLGTFHNPQATFAFDQARAGQILDAAGWVPGSDGIRVKDGQRAAFTLMYFPSETLRRDLSLAFTSDAKKIGIEVNLEGVDRPQFRPRIPQDAGLLGGGDNPYDPDTQVYATLHSSYAQYDANNPFRNPGAYRNEAVDAALDAGRRSVDPAERTRAYQDMQAELIKAPSNVMLAYLDHTYVMKDGDWTGTRPVLEPHSHGVSWGPWWNLRDWKPGR